ncbi:MAG: ABC transporter permease subunit [Planctomycetota bacterium]|jgi:ABC-2 type transport system permease protein
MSGTLAIYRRELKAYFDTPIAAIFIAILVGLLSYFLFKDSLFFVRERAEMRIFFRQIPAVLMVFAPVITMRLWADEYRVGTAEILGSLPISTRSLVLGKYLAALTVLAAALVCTIGVPISIARLGEPDWGPIIGGYIGSFLLGSFFIALGCWTSSLSENQVISMLIAVLVGVIFTFILTPRLAAVIAGESATLARAVEGLGVTSHFDSIERGVLALRDVSYFLLGTLFFLTLNAFQVESRRV